MAKNLDYSKLNDVCKYQKTEEAEAWRLKEWKVLDFNDNGYVSLSEFETWIKHWLPEFFYGDGNQYKIAFRYAYNKSRLMVKVQQQWTKTKKTLNEDYITYPEFRFMLLYTRMFLEFYNMFDELDTSNDKKIQFKEFELGVQRLNEWGAKIENPREEFSKIDNNGTNAILFDEFIKYALEADLDLNE